MRRFGMRADRIWLNSTERDNFLLSIRDPYGGIATTLRQFRLWRVVTHSHLFISRTTVWRQLKKFFFKLIQNHVIQYKQYSQWRFLDRVERTIECLLGDLFLFDECHTFWDFSEGWRRGGISEESAMSTTQKYFRIQTWQNIVKNYTGK